MYDFRKVSRYRVRSLSIPDRNWVADVLDQYWGSTRIVSRGVIHYAHELPGLMLVDEKDTCYGLIIFNIDQKDCQIIILNSFAEGVGVGTSLVETVIDIARKQMCDRVWLITTNDNIHAFRWWQRRGFEICAVYCNVVNDSRKKKPEIPIIGIDDIPIRDEIEFEMKLEYL